MKYALGKVDGTFHVMGLPQEVSSFPDTLLIVRYPEGDCDTISGRLDKSNWRKLHQALYDLFQTCHTLKAGDQFYYPGPDDVLFACEGVHVIPVGRAAAHID